MDLIGGSAHGRMLTASGLGPAIRQEAKNNASEEDSPQTHQEIPQAFDHHRTGQWMEKPIHGEL
jgi:hypothetical protein